MSFYSRRCAISAFCFGVIAFRFKNHRYFLTKILSGNSPVKEYFIFFEWLIILNINLFTFA
ncbi:MAG: hypothetical protein CVU14_01480 [Bacteroidetes bacterium HGW-Bacteroidetes-9]|nr:MAG: hypothetical protein CVU14_01480 [Bacteroidetes bacterium HGW-Bacteroidetes-9]